jgi:UDP-N-acetylmuramate dehydrogenase
MFDIDLNNTEFIRTIRNQMNDLEVRIGEPLKSYTSFQIGGPCDYFFVPHSKEALSRLLSICKDYSIDVFILGNGSNLLVTDKGFRGAVVQIYKNFSQIRIEGNIVIAEAGILLSTLANVAAKHELAGLEFASGIPGTLGGAVYMNAGAYDGEMKHVVKQVVAMGRDGEEKNFDSSSLDFGYRHSGLQKNAFIAIEVMLELEKGKADSIKHKMKELNTQRKEKQPLELPSAGSTFKRPEGYFAGKLIMEAGLSGFAIGGAQVSEKHCGFVVNTGNATFYDVDNLVKHIQKTVYDKFGVSLEREIKIIGER